MGSEDVPFWLRVAWFLGYALFAGLVSSALVRWTKQLAWTRDYGWRRFLVIATSLTPIMAFAVWLSIGSVGGRFEAAELPRYLLISLVASFALTGLAYVVFRPTPVTHAALAGAAPPRLLARLPVALRTAELWAVEAEDHYLRVHTSRGRELILMRLVDAIDELDGIEGAQTHRSWWVARAAVKDVKRHDGRATLALPDGLEAPVSRTYLRTLRESGWL